MFQEIVESGFFAVSLAVDSSKPRLFHRLGTGLAVLFEDVRVDQLSVTVVSGDPTTWGTGAIAGRVILGTACRIQV